MNLRHHPGPIEVRFHVFMTIIALVIGVVGGVCATLVMCIYVAVFAPATFILSIPGLAIWPCRVINGECVTVSCIMPFYWLASIVAIAFFNLHDSLFSCVGVFQSFHIFQMDQE